ncbi:GNAT family N-acetyltransferase [Staphylococcus epidermidis]|uniref:GNAT family N-acetyltransferase n=1 Tax=Staphylococcus epidermidis TaxID=1282 RepID=UPI00026C015C|nr:GNAT family N-acetyltransferase [Staphylococcus epidermidis]EJE27959.1 acetyltransferase, GNAT family [Staphylococcus epidermidis NIHLM001]MCG2450496.1 GNAT family N-acetyltransferase [Staphylococcus epidermidis]MCO6257734.1 GNAT family N-acetyltransferase [Staphylococcus epidermidis]NJI77622.1 GNAT family N-acetyltransferase [Staphylococcus epidermidis]
MTHLIREISIKDVENFISLLSQIYDESEFTFYNPGEYSPTISSASQHLEKYITSPTKAIYVAESDEQLVGYVFVNTETYERTQHEVVVYLGVREYYQHQGIGQALINRIEAWALNHHIRRIEATVVTENINAIELFKGMGFQIEGELKDKLFINQKYYNEYVMAKILN